MSAILSRPQCFNSGVWCCYLSWSCLFIITKLCLFTIGLKGTGRKCPVAQTYGDIFITLWKCVADEGGVGRVCAPGRHLFPGTRVSWWLHRVMHKENKAQQHCCRELNCCVCYQRHICWRYASKMKRVVAIIIVLWRGMIIYELYILVHTYKKDDFTLNTWNIPIFFLMMKQNWVRKWLVLGQMTSHS